MPKWRKKIQQKRQMETFLTKCTPNANASSIDIPHLISKWAELIFFTLWKYTRHQKKVYRMISLVFIYTKPTFVSQSIAIDIPSQFWLMSYISAKYVLVIIKLFIWFAKNVLVSMNFGCVAKVAAHPLHLILVQIQHLRNKLVTFIWSWSTNYF